MTKLTKSITQTKRGIDETTLHIEVEYNPRTREVGQVYSFGVYNFKHNVYTDMMPIFFEQFDQQFDAIIESIDWAEVYAESFEGKHFNTIPFEDIPNDTNELPYE